MASAVQLLRLCLRACRDAPAPRRLAPRLFHVPTARQISTTPVRWSSKPEEDDLEDLEDDYEGLEEREPTRMHVESLPDFNKEVAALEKEFGEIDESISIALKTPTPKSMKNSFWLEDEEDPDYMVEGLDDDDFSEDDIMSMAHGKLEEHREYREYARIAAWQMPLLAKLARPFEPPAAEQCLRFRYTTYLGETHPAQHKVVVEFSPQDLPLNEAQQLKLKKLLGARWNPETDVVKMSCEQFGHQAQNKRYLGDLVAKLVAQARDSTDMYEDIPLDMRHHKFRVKPKFPKEWRLTEERRKEIEDARQKSLLLDQAKEEAGTLVDGKEKVRKFFAEPPPELRIPQLVAQRLPSRLTPRMKWA